MSGSIHTPFSPQHLVVLGAGQRRQAEELEDVERQLLLDDLDVVADRLRRVGREAEDVAGIGDDAAPVFQASSILRYSVILFCRFFAAIRLAGLMFSSPMNTRVTPARAAFSMKFGILWQSVSTWMIMRDVHAVALAQLDDAVEDRLPVLVAGEIVVGDEEPVEAVAECCAEQVLDVVGRAAARLAALHVDDGAERALDRGSRGRRRSCA